MLDATAMELNARIEAISVRMDKMDIKLGAMCSRQSEILNLLHHVDDNVRNHGEMLARHSQWLEGHGAVHDAVEKRVDGLANRVNVFSGINVAITAVMGAIASWLGGKGY